MPGLTSKLLVAVPQLSDENFRQTVVLILEHSEHGAIGLVLNRPTTLKLSDLWQQMTGKKAKAPGTLFVGGPCEARLVALHTMDQWGNNEILPGLFLTHEPADLEKLLVQGADPLRLFTGCAGWGPGQIEQELEEGTWFVAEAQMGTILGEPDRLWRLVTDAIGRRICFTEKELERLPADPELN